MRMYHCEVRPTFSLRDMYCILDSVLSLSLSLYIYIYIWPNQLNKINIFKQTIELHIAYKLMLFRNV